MGIWEISELETISKHTDWSSKIHVMVNLLGEQAQAYNRSISFLVNQEYANIFKLKGYHIPEPCQR